MLFGQAILWMDDLIFSYWDMGYSMIVLFPRKYDSIIYKRSQERSSASFWNFFFFFLV